MPCSKHRAAFFVLTQWALFLSAASHVAVADEPRNSSKLPRSSEPSEVKRRIEEQKRRLEQRRKELDASVRRMDLDAAKRRNPSFDAKAFDELKRRAAAMRPRELPKPPPFDAAAAGPPEEFLLRYVSVAKNATSMEQIIGFLRADEQRGLKSFQAGHDPEVAAKRRAEYRREGRLEEGSIVHLTNTPYANALKQHQAIARKFIAVLHVHVEGNKADIEVSTHSTAVVNGKLYPFSTARWELVGEGLTWRMGNYADGPLSYTEPPAKRPQRKKSVD